MFLSKGVFVEFSEVAAGGAVEAIAGGVADAAVGADAGQGRGQQQAHCQRASVDSKPHLGLNSAPGIERNKKYYN